MNFVLPSHAWVRCSVFAFAFQIECSDQSVLFFFYYFRLNWIENSITWIRFLGVGFQSNCFVIWQFNCIIFRSHSNINWNMFCCNWMYNEKLWFGFGFLKNSSGLFLTSISRGARAVLKIDYRILDALICNHNKTKKPKQMINVRTWLKWLLSDLERTRITRAFVLVLETF